MLLCDYYCKLYELIFDCSDQHHNSEIKFVHCYIVMSLSDYHHHLLSSWKAQEVSITIIMCCVCVWCVSAIIAQKRYNT